MQAGLYGASERQYRSWDAGCVFAPSFYAPPLLYYPRPSLTQSDFPQPPATHCRAEELACIPVCSLSRPHPNRFLKPLVDCFRSCAPPSSQSLSHQVGAPYQCGAHRSKSAAKSTGFRSCRSTLCVYARASACGRKMRACTHLFFFKFMREFEREVSREYVVGVTERVYVG